MSKLIVSAQKLYVQEIPAFHVSYIVSRLPIPSTADGHFIAASIAENMSVNFYVRVSELDGFLTIEYEVDGERKTQGFHLKRVQWWKKFWRMRCTCGVLVAKMLFAAGRFACFKCQAKNVKSPGNPPTVREILAKIEFARTREQKISAVRNYLLYVLRAKNAIIKPRRHLKFRPKG